MSQSRHSSRHRYYAERVHSLEHLVDLCLTEANGPFVCRAHELNALVTPRASRPGALPAARPGLIRGRARRGRQGRRGRATDRPQGIAWTTLDKGRPAW